MADVYTPPQLADDPGALEPYISGRIMALHHAIWNVVSWSDVDARLAGARRAPS